MQSCAYTRRVSRSMEHYSISVSFATHSDRGGRHAYQQPWLYTTPAHAPEPVASLAYVSPSNPTP
eukprot:11179263-Lingulodinium_polyedra.AAC.1